MKKVFIPVVAALLVAFTIAQAQTENRTVSAIARGSVPGIAPVTTEIASLAGVYKHAFRSFSKMYKDVIPTDWSILTDKSVKFEFADRGMKTRVFYTAGGVWLYTVVSYEEGFLSKDVRDVVKRAYYDMAITYVDEVRSPGADPVYRVQLQNSDRLVIVKVRGDEMEVERELFKLHR